MGAQLFRTPKYLPLSRGVRPLFSSRCMIKPDSGLFQIGNNLGWIGGQVFTGGIWRAFWAVGNDIDFIEGANGNDSEVTGIDGHGDVAGCHDANSRFISFGVENSAGEEREESFPMQTKLAWCPASVKYSRVSSDHISALAGRMHLWEYRC